MARRQATAFGTVVPGRGLDQAKSIPRCGTLADMSCWQYAQLTITVDGRAPQAGARTIIWHGPGQGVGENCSDSQQTVLELLNRFGADGWELAGLQDYREGGDGFSYWEGGPAAYRVHVQTPSPGLVMMVRDLGSSPTWQRSRSRNPTRIG